MAIQETIRGPVPDQLPGQTDRLSGFECRCLHQRLNDCEQALCRALLGVDEARTKTHDAQALVDISEELAQAESHIVRALYVAAAGEKQ